jgi:hypothetical protein
MTTEDTIITVKLIETIGKIHETKVPHIMIQKDLDAKLELTEKEKHEIRKTVVAEFKQRNEELEANILAYQDLLITKEMEIVKLTEQLSKIVHSNEVDMKEKFEVLMTQFNQVSSELQKERNPHSLVCCKRHYMTGRRDGPCSEAALTSYVYRRIDDLNNDFTVRAEVIHAKYQKEFDEFKRKHLRDLEDVDERIQTAIEVTQRDNAF